MVTFFLAAIMRMPSIAKSLTKMIANGAKTAFDIWYEWDKSKFESNHIFAETLEYVRKNNCNVLVKKREI